MRANNELQMMSLKAKIALWGLVWCLMQPFGIMQISLASKVSLHSNHRQTDDQAGAQLAAMSVSNNSNSNNEVVEQKYQSTLSPDIVINSIEDELSEQVKSRLRYEQPTTSGSSSEAGSGETETDKISGHQTDAQASKLEPRNQLEALQESTASNQQDPVIIDHRPLLSETTNKNHPTPSADQLQQVTADNSANASSQSPLQQQQQPHHQQQQQQLSSSNNPPLATSPSISSTVHTQAQAQPNTATISATQLLPQPWQSNTQPQFYFASQPLAGSGGNSQQQFGSMTSGSNQIMSVQHPTSINSIISEQQRPGASGQSSNMQLASSSGKSTPLVIVGQPTNQQTGNPHAQLLQPQTQLVGIGQNGRRVSISNWLRGIGSMLANIFNRREHGAGLQQAMLASNLNGVTVLSPSSNGQLSTSPSGTSNWLQIGPSAPHWLTQAQSAIQQFQQQHQLTSSNLNRFTTFLQQTPQTSQSQQQVGGDLQQSGSTNSYVSVQMAPPSSPSQTPYQTGPVVLSTSAQPASSVSRQSQATVKPTQTAIGRSGGQTNPTEPTLAPVGAIKQITSGEGASRARFGRSSTTTRNHLVSPSAMSTSQITAQNLPLAHYSRFTIPDQ